MVFPLEAEHRAKRRALRLCQDHLREVVDVYRKTTQLIDAFAKNDQKTLSTLSEEIQKSSDNVDDSKRAIAQELAEIGTILISREDFLRFTYVISEIADFCKGISFRLSEMLEREWEISKDIKESIVELGNAVFDTFANLRDTFLMLNYGSPKVLEKARDVELAERNVDNIYRKLEIDILGRGIETPILLLTRDIIQLLEDAADKMEDASDAARILAFAV